MRLEGKSALVLGASRGVGKQVALKLAADGADVALAARTLSAGQSPLPGSVEETAAEIHALGRRAVPIAVEASDGADVDRMCATALDAFGKIDIFVHSMQYIGPNYFDLFVDSSIDEFEKQVGADLMSAIRACRTLVPKMIERRDGLVVLVTSAAGTSENDALPGQGAPGLGYSTSKAGLIRFILGLAKEVRQHDVAIVGVDPGFTYSEIVQVGEVDGVYHSWPTKFAHPMNVPAEAIRYVCSAENRMEYSGKNLVATELVEEHSLLPQS